MKKIFYPLFLFIFFIILIFFQIHSSSLGIYHQYFYGNKKDPNLIFNQPRSIRSDEWLVGTPKVLAQIKADFPVVNKNIGHGEVMPIQGCLPYKHWRVLFCPNMWGFFFLPLEQGYAFMWWTPVFLMMTGIYLLILLLTKSVFLSIFSSLIFFFSPFNQWWSYSLAPFLGYLSFFGYFFIKSIENKKTITSLIYFILAICFFISFVFILYPPFQVVSFYIFFFFLIGYFLSKKIIFDKKLLIYTFLTIISSGVLILLFYKEFKETIDIVRNTVYPGKRFIANTLGDLNFLINGFYNIQLQDDIKGSGPFSNQSEASNFFLLSLFALPVYWWIILRQLMNKRIDWIFLSINIIFLILLIWFLFPLPSFLAKISFLYLVPQKRTIIGIGIASYLLMFYFLNNIKFKKDKFYSFLSIFSSIFIFLVNLYFGFWLKFNFPVFIQNNLKIFLISSFSGLLLFLLLNQYKKTFLILFLVFSFISSYRVNPLYKGLEIIFTNPISELINQIDNKTTNGRIAIFDESLIITIPLVLNKKLITTVYYYPQLEIWKNLDPFLINKNIYNRYAHVYFLSITDKKIFVSPFSDLFYVNVNVCEKTFREFFKINNISLLIYPTQKKDKCLRLKGEYKGIRSYYLYQFSEDSEN